MIIMSDVFKLRDSVDIYKIDDNILCVYFMNTRKELKYRVNEMVFRLISNIDGKKSLKEIKESLQKYVNYEIKKESIISAIKFLYSKNIIYKLESDKKQFLTTEEIEKYDRQINFFQEFLIGENSGYIAQKKLKESKILVFGCGAIGGTITLQLAMAGVENFILYDGDRVEKSDISRHLFFKKKYIGKYKVEALKNELQLLNKRIHVEAINKMLLPNSNISDLIDKATLVINTADEPYIGYTSLKISRECIAKDKVHYIGGGFDAHLASTGELIIPGKTPCAECYSKHFERALVNWKPEKKKILSKNHESGGLAAMSLFSASYATNEIIKYICGLVNYDNYQTRGEFLFDSYSIDYLKVERDEKCSNCGGKKNETKN